MTKDDTLRIDLNGLWRFCPDPNGMGEKLGFSLGTYDDTPWREVQVPGDFEMCLPGLDAYEGPAWYRRWIDIPEDWENYRISLNFEGINVAARVYVNGILKKNCVDPYLPFEVELSDIAIPGQRMLIAVCVDNTRHPELVPGLDRGWRTYGGLLRGVSLLATELCYVHRVEVTAEQKSVDGELKGRYLITNTSSLDCVVEIQWRLLDADGRSVWKRMDRIQRLESGNDGQFSFVEKVPHVTAWSPNNPYLYKLVARVSVNSGIYKVHETRVGFRTIEVKDGKLLLNGEPTYLTGFNRHEDSLKRHMCVDLETARHDFEEMKRAGANFVRLCHYPHDAGELDLCDELGLLVMEEIPLYWWKGMADGEDVYKSKLERARTQLSELINRDMHHPSVIIWSVSNESEEDKPGVVEGNAKLIDYVHQIDPSRLAVHVSNHWLENPHFDDDLICVNSYPSVFNKNDLVNGSYELSQSTEYWAEHLCMLHERYPDKPVLVAEFGYEAVLYVTDGAWSEDRQAEVLKAEFEGMQADYVCGATVWCWADHPWPPSTFSFVHYLGISPYGVVGRDRRRAKKGLFAIRDLFRAKQAVVEKKSEREMRTDAGIPVVMIRQDLDDLPVHPLPEGYTIRTLRDDEGGLWTDIWRDAEPFGDIGNELYHHEFGQDYAATTWRTFIVEDERKVAVATITSWYSRTFRDEDYGQIHWVATRQSQWGKGIGRGMLSHALHEMSKWHKRAFLGTQTNRIPAIKLYLDFGFIPDMDQPYAEQAWREVKAVLNHPVLDGLDL